MGKDECKDLDRIKKLVDLMIDKGLAELEIVDGDDKIHLKRSLPTQPVITQIPVGQMPAGPVAVAGAGAGASGGVADIAVAAGAAAGGVQGEDLSEIPSPIVGTYYAAAGPDSEPFVGVGSRVEVDSVVCIIEAMKVMNEIKAEIGGTVVEVLCKAGEAVEFGQALFKVRPD